MSRIRSRANKKTEIALARIFRQHGIRGWRRHQPLPGRPDFVFYRARVAIFVDGCYWHGCRKHFRMPANNTEFWRAKITTNRRRDRKVSKQLMKDGWRVLRIWEHELGEADAVVARVTSAFASSAQRPFALARASQGNIT